MKLKKISIFCLWSFCTVCAPLVHADAWSQQRWQFNEAQQALTKGDVATFNKIVETLQDYPIVHYLRYFYLKSYLETVSNADVQAFLDKYSDSPAGLALQVVCLKKLGEKQDWPAFLAAYTPQKDVSLQCYQLQARIATEQELTGVVEAAKELWLVGKDQPSVCDPVFAYFYEQAPLTDDLRWQRIRLAMQEGNLKLASQLSKDLPEVDKQKVVYWQELYQKPDKVLKKFDYADTPLTREMLLQGVKRLAREEADTAHTYWEHYQKKYAVTAEESAQLSRYIAVQGAKQNLPEASTWLAAIPNDLADVDVRQARLQAALAKPDWPAVLNLVALLPTAEQNNPQWQYWQARALAETQQMDKAKEMFTALAKLRDFYGFLAAERLQQSYQFQAKSSVVDKEAQKTLLAKPNILYARELFFVGLTDFARQEWRTALSTLTPAELMTAATLASAWNWYDQAIATATKAKMLDDLTIRFPTPFYDMLLKQTSAQKLDFAWVYALIRQESAFQVDARSVSNALGLMQLLPDTAKEVAKKQKVPLKEETEIFVPEKNIRLGTGYLHYLLDRFADNRVLATAAYNAGPNRVARWLEQFKCLPGDIWVEMIPINQTRDYVQRVLSYTLIYEFRLVGHTQIEPLALAIANIGECSTKSPKK